MTATLLAMVLVQNMTVPLPPKLPWRNLASRVEAIKEWGASFLVHPGMTREQVLKVMGTPFGMDTFGPPGQSSETFSYLFSGVLVSFDAKGRVTDISR